MANTLKTREKIGYATGDFASCLIWQSITIYLLYYCTNVAGIETAAAVSILSVSKFIDGFTDILMGFIVDRTKTRFGKVRPYLLTMGLPLAISTVMLFTVPASLSTHGKLVWVFVAYNLVTSVFYTALNVPYSSMHCFLTGDSEERSRLSILRLIFAFASQVLINAVVFSLVRRLGGGELGDQAGWTRAMIVIGACCFLLTLVTFFNTKERVSGGATGGGSVTVRDSLGSILRNKYLLILLAATLSTFTAASLYSGSAAYYAQFILKDVDATGLITNAVTAAQVVSLIVIVPQLIKRYKKRMIYRLGSGALAVCYLASCIRPDNLPALIALNIVKGAAQGCSGSMLYAMCADAVDYGEWKTGVSSAGLGVAMVQCLGKFGMGLGTALLGVILSFGGFAATAEAQTAGGTAALVAVYTWLPGLFMVLTWSIMALYRLDAEYPRIIAELKERREAAARKKG